MYARSRTRRDAQTPCAVPKRCTETTRTETKIMEAGMPTPPWPTNEPMDAIDRLRVDGQPVVRTWRGDHKTRYEFGCPLEDTHLAGETQKSRRTPTRRRSKRLAATIESVEAPETVR